MNPKDLQNRKILLASKSPRRHQLLREAGFNFEVKTMDIEEIYPEDLPNREVAAYLAELKATAAKHLLKNGEILLTADTIVIQDNIIYGKPKDRADAINILKKLSANMHEVITGVCLMSAEKSHTFSTISKVYFEPISDEEIAYYLDNYQPYDKAGAYAIQEWIGHCKISKIEGTYSNIMGLPMETVYKKLMAF
jgi:septum formation protein